MYVKFGVKSIAIQDQEETSCDFFLPVLKDEIGTVSCLK